MILAGVLLRLGADGSVPEAMGEPALRNERISEGEYLAGEELTEEAHEYIDGRVFAMSVPTDTHGEIAGNVYTSLHAHLRGKACRPFMGNMRVRISYPKVAHYIPDVLIACDDPPRDSRFREQPLAIWEILSGSTEAIDRREKLSAYTLLPSVRHYFLVRQDRMEVTHVRRAGPGWEDLVLTQPDQALVVPELGWSLSLAEVYAGIRLRQG